MSGIFKGTQARVLEKQPLAIYVHCTNHCANLACQDLAKSWNLTDCERRRCHDKKFCQKVEYLQYFCSDSWFCIQCSIPLCTTRWTVRVSAISRVLESFEVVLETLTEIGSSTSDAACSARGLIMQFQKAEVLFGLLVCLELFTPMDQLSTVLQRSSLSVAGAKEAVKTVLCDVMWVCVCAVSD